MRKVVGIALMAVCVVASGVTIMAGDFDGSTQVQTRSGGFSLFGGAVTFTWIWVDVDTTDTSTSPWYGVALLVGFLVGLMCLLLPRGSAGSNDCG
jgi:hypothetical protein